ncbi:MULTISPECIES: LA2681 family HEPN domain-containing protein [Sphingomonas]|uniref:LA2681 family HEPN domain-containing protein n=1 Tax=Sphingomonas molluscorum TaxID=418184 RepID=A0ABU8Q3S4_9SPHN|nr:LA2681 family HEPN domain-containing protein [Sphingomonas sp. JUb134]MBM7405912.1 tetratricopeptide (TPR) repeat protein [Sphingomonas sp. JUb134]
MPTTAEMEKLRERSIAKLDADAALDHIATLVDTSLDAQFQRGVERALYLLDELAKRELTPRQGALIEYFRANAWSAKEELAGERGSWDWEHAEREQQILALSRAAAHPGFAELDIVRCCQILTNRANQLDTMGRFVDAIEGWDKALQIVPNFAMALANRGFGLKHYAGLLEDDRERAILLLHAHDGFAAALAPDAIYEGEDQIGLRRQFAATAAEYAAAADLDRIRALQDLDGTGLGRSKAERAYRRWCLDRRLFLNPLNDLGAFTVAAFDDLVLPTIMESFADRPGAFTPAPVFGFFNQMKQEYASARFMLYEGLNSTKLHFSDLGVRLFDTLDYPAHSLATERVRTAYRIAYSLLDKVAFLVDHVWKLGKIADRINFKNVWMVEGKPRLLDRFKAYPNWPLRGLYWLSKELFDDEIKRTTAADARELHDIRNALEHKYLQVHEGWAWDLMLTLPASNGLGLSINSDLLEAKALRMMKIARAALIQLALAIGVEERNKAAAAPDRLIGSMPLYALEERRKRRDPSW